MSALDDLDRHLAEAMRLLEGQIEAQTRAEQGQHAVAELWRRLMERTERIEAKVGKLGAVKGDLMRVEEKLDALIAGLKARGSL